MRKIFLALALAVASYPLLPQSKPALAACAVTNLQVKDNAAVTAAVPYADDGSGASNCSPQIQIKQGGNVANVTAGNALKVDASGTTVPLPTGAATSALQPTNAAQASTTSGQTGTLVQGAVTTSAPTYTTGQTDPLSLDTAGRLSVAINGGSAINANGTTTAANSSPTVQALDLVNSTTGNIAANNTTAVVVNAAATTVYSIQLGGIGSAPAYLKLYNATSATCGSGTPVKRLIIPAAATAANGAGSNVVFPLGLRFSTGLTYCITTGITDADTTAPAASTFLVNIDWH